jgi:pyridinium-3,5-biscarboxylic acid mononucleotide sulfurtransferase
MKSDDASRDLQRLQEAIRKKGALAIAYSGGVDSGLLAVVAGRELGKGCRCFTLDSAIVPRRAVEDAKEAAERFGFAHEIVPFPILEDPEFRKNPENRCYLCKKASSRLLREHAARRGFGCVADGVNVSDLDEYRPGLQASDEEGVLHPFIEAGMSKADLRRAAKACGLEFWNKPSSACLASRIPYGEEITEEKLRMIEAAEEYLQGRGFTQLRVRMHENIARIEVLPDDMEALLSLREEIVSALREIGFAYVTLDLAGFRSGSMDEVL